MGSSAWYLGLHFGHLLFSFGGVEGLWCISTGIPGQGLPAPICCAGERFTSEGMSIFYVENVALCCEPDALINVMPVGGGGGRGGAARGGDLT